MRQYINTIRDENFLLNNTGNFNYSIITTAMVNDFLLMIGNNRKGPDNDN